MKGLLKKLVIAYLTLLAYIKLKIKFKGRIIGVGGCYGKTSAVSLIQSLLSDKFNVFSTSIEGKGLNSESGIPFAILNIKPDLYSVKDWISYLIQGTKNLFNTFKYDIVILEMGVDKPGDMKHLTKYFRPDIGILLNSNNTHSANFKELHETTSQSYEDLIAHENGFMFERAREVIFYNLEDPQVVAQITRFKGTKKIGFSTQSKSHILEFSPSIEGTNIKLRYKNNNVTIKHKLPLLEEYKTTFELIINIAEYFALEIQSLTKAIENFEIPPGRCSLFEGINNTYIIDSSYNSSLVPAISALFLLQKIAPKRKIAILGDMRELGDLAEKEHNRLALIAAKTVDVVITVGPLMKSYFADQFRLVKRENQQIFTFDTTKETLEFVLNNFLQEQDTVLIKGSQNTLFLETIVEALLANKKDKAKLCRRDKLYEQKRQELLKGN
ncbi:MAG: UDP-N-acetylmuramoyl-tripeptide--D-alanyl-D-alanine ligase [Candidatus Dojkabacteria bacterium]|nr:MAG: UDP-N-acetylmuramoyl-tripeptide--D-alanyl-D-alanine ligase [Candidatus Dojkabacteria bacterium]